MPSNTAAIAIQKPAEIPLATKLQPTQARSLDTYEVVLATAGEMLREVGFEQLTTNSICGRAGLTPPALYRYFPNKYAILKVLGDRLMDEQDRAVLDWLDRGGLDGTSDERLGKSVELQREVVAITRRFPGGAAIGRALRAVPMLQRLRFTSRDMIADRFLDAVRARYPNTPEARLRVAMRMMIELSYAAGEMVVEEPDRDAELLNVEVCRLFAIYFDTFD
ncbi:TetR/AcrR family transcriptional regulator [Glacieibacterium megasporae]|uniref:TetR/AcrR family transcriptional regulator n=1 Tax=Glacieibacterium megasporae TaxID=2835787 RepID=UPI001C1E438D|nr:TetR/AcrR family transcriptional regulator [Polymorphobacter megasporae]UAJ09387.1 TetR/AcrR family transcriptional regulator [Polymorphobacter megasporae]